MLSQCQYDASYHADNEPMVQSNTAAWALTTLVQEQQLTTPEVVEISNEERVDNGTAGVNTDIDDLGGGKGLSNWMMMIFMLLPPMLILQLLLFLQVSRNLRVVDYVKIRVLWAL
jgi:hypothetical protein